MSESWLRVTDGAVPVGGVDYVSTRDDDEYLIETDIGECIGEYLDDLEEIPDTIELFGFVRNKVTGNHVSEAAEQAFQAVIGYLEDPENLISHPDPHAHSGPVRGRCPYALRAGIRDAINAVTDDLFVWQCTHVVTWEVDVAEWRRINEIRRIER